MSTPSLVEQLSQVLEFDFERMAEYYRSLGVDHPAWSLSVGVECGARWQHARTSAVVEAMLDCVAAVENMPHWPDLEGEGSPHICTRCESLAKLKQAVEKAGK
jgi:hypothetical protein